MKTYKYQLPSETIQLSFCSGGVEAESELEAKRLASMHLKYHIEKVNHVLSSADVTIDFRVYMDLSKIEIKEV